MNQSAFLVVCLNPTLQVTVTLDSLRVGQVNRARATRLDASGKGVNVARVLHQLGERVVHLTQTGGRYEDEFRALVAEDGLKLEPVHGSIEIRHCYTLLAREERSTTEIVEPGGEADAVLEAAVLSRFLELLPASHTVIISGSKARGFSDELFPSMVREAKAAGVATVLDYRGTDLVNSLEYEPDLVKINVSEFAATFLDEAIPEDLPQSRMPESVGAELLRRASLHQTRIVLTNGSEPVQFVDGRRVETVAPASVEPVNTIGAGDAMTAGIAAGLHRGTGLSQAIRLGLDCARRNVLELRPGVIR